MKLDNQYGFRNNEGFFSREVSISRHSIFNFAFICITTKKEPIKVKIMEFTTEVEDVVVMEAVSYTLERTLVTPSNIVWRY